LTSSGATVELAKIMRYKQAVWQDWKDGEITHSDHRHMSEDYERQIQAIKAVLDNLTAERAELENGIDTENPFLVAFRKHENIDCAPCNHSNSIN